MMVFVSIGDINVVLNILIVDSDPVTIDQQYHSQGSKKYYTEKGSLIYICEGIERA